MRVVLNTAIFCFFAALMISSVGTFPRVKTTAEMSMSAAVRITCWVSKPVINTMLFPPGM